MKTEIEIKDFPNGQRKREIPFVNGKRHGLAKRWYENGQMMYETPYTNGHRHGLSEWWHSNRQRKREIPYVNGQIHGLSKQWRRDGSAAYLTKLHKDQWVWDIHLPSEEKIPADAEVELFFH